MAGCGGGRLPVSQASCVPILRQQAGKRGRSGVRKAKANQRRDNLLVINIGMAMIPILDLKAIAQQFHNQCVYRGAPGLRKSRVAINRRNQYFEPSRNEVSPNSISPVWLWACRSRSETCPNLHSS